MSGRVCRPVCVEQDDPDFHAREIPVRLQLRCDMALGNSLLDTSGLGEAGAEVKVMLGLQRFDLDSPTRMVNSLGVVALRVCPIRLSQPIRCSERRIARDSINAGIGARVEGIAISDGRDT